LHIKKRGRYLTCFILVVSLTFSLFVTKSTYTTANADSLSSLKSQYSELQQKQHQLQEQINKLNSEVTTASKKKSTLDEDVTLTKQQISLLNTQINATQTQLDSKNKDIATTQKSVDANIAQYKVRVCTIYEAGNTSDLQILLASKSISDFLMRYEVIKVVSDHDNQVINSLKQDEIKLQSDKSAIQNDMTDLMSSKGTLAAKNDMLNSQVSQQKALVSQLKDNVTSTQAQSDEVQQKARQTDAQINAIIAQEAAARARQLAQEAGQSGSAGSGGGRVSATYLVKFAEGFEGVPYVFGSADPRYGFDCSGFVQYVFANAAGIALTHSAAAQYGCGTYVSQSNLEPGDLVFFDTDGGGVSHVGIYVGNDEFIEANSGAHSADEVIVTGLFDSSYWASRYVGARRILNS
jgi:cell wall-associated NlpC family hydrolase